MGKSSIPSIVEERYHVPRVTVDEDLLVRVRVRDRVIGLCFTSISAIYSVLK